MLIFNMGKILEIKQKYSEISGGNVQTLFEGDKLEISKAFKILNLVFTFQRFIRGKIYYNENNGKKALCMKMLLDIDLYTNKSSKKLKTI